MLTKIGKLNKDKNMTNEESKAQHRYMWSKEDIDLLISELCQRMPYGIKLQKREEEDTVYTLYSINLQSNEICFWKYQGESLRIADTGRIHRFGIPFYKPYLLPLSSMTPKQKIELVNLTCEISSIFKTAALEIEFYIKNHIDYRGLIEKGLAIDATNLNVYNDDSTTII